MKPVLVGFSLLILSTAVAWTSSSKVSAGAMEKQATWAPGQYRGWIYFLAKEETAQEYNLEDITGHGDIVAFLESHSDLSCAVQGNGSGMCKAAFPMDITLSHEYVFSVPDCTIRGGLRMRSVSIDASQPNKTLASKSLGDELAISFEPAFGPAEGRQYLLKEGSEECDESMASVFKGPHSIQFPSGSITLRVGARTALTVEGICSMDGLPRQTEFPMGPGAIYRDSISILECRWMVFQIDLSVIPPEGGSQ